MDKARLKEIEERAERATPGPWKWGGSPRAQFGAANELTVRSAGEFPHGKWIADVGRIQEREANAEFIAHARTDVPDLLAEVRRLNTAFSRLVWIVYGDCISDETVALIANDLAESERQPTPNGHEDAAQE